MLLTPTTHRVCFPGAKGLRATLQLMLLLLAFSSCYASDKERVLLVLGDSISAEYGLAQDSGWVAMLARALPGYRVVNASISGETSAGGLQRLPDLLQRHRPNILIIELGGNDGLRGYPVQQLRNNLRQMIAMARGSGARVLLAGMRIPPNYGRRYTELFFQSYLTVADEADVALLPFLLEQVATRREWMQEDGIHPNQLAQRQILDNVISALQPLLQP